MKSCSNPIWLFLFLIFISHILSAQENFAEIGKPAPDIVIKNIKYYSKKQLTTKDFKGKWYVLDFWNKYCSSCVASFPRINSLQQEFKDKVDFILIGRQDKENGIESMYEKFKSAKSLNIPVVFDSGLHNILGIFATPYIIVIDNKGIVRALTIELTSNDIKDFLSGKTPVLSRALRKEEDTEISYDETKPLLVNGNGGNDTNFLYRSLLCSWNQRTSDRRPVSITKILKAKFHKFETLGASLKELYKYAYFDYNTLNPYDSLYGTISKEIIFETNDTLLFESDGNKSKNIFSYSVIVPPSKATIAYIQEIMRSDLKRYFDYEAIVETRKMPYWKLIATEDAKVKLRSKGGKEKMTASNTGFTLVNYSSTMLRFELWAFHQDEPPFIDETGISGNIDITIDAILTDLTDIDGALQKNGLKLVKSEKDMKVLVIRKAK